MSITVQWGNEAQTLALIAIEGTYSSDEFVRAVDQINTLMGTVEHKATPAVDFTNASGLPGGAIANYRRIADRMGHPNSTGRLIVIGVRSGLRPLLEIFAVMYRKIEYVDTLEEARDVAARITGS